MHHPAARLCARREILCLSSLYSPVLKIKDSPLLSHSPRVDWVSGPVLPAFEDYREEQGRSLLCWLWPLGTVLAQYSFFCSGEFTVLNKDSADTHSLLSFLFTECNSSFSTNKRTSKHLQVLFPLIIPSWKSAVPLLPSTPRDLRNHHKQQHKPRAEQTQPEQRGSQKAAQEPESFVSEWGVWEVHKHQDTGINKGIASLPMCPSWFNFHHTISTQLVFSLFSALIKMQTMSLANI